MIMWMHPPPWGLDILAWVITVRTIKCWARLYNYSWKEVELFIQRMMCVEYDAKPMQLMHNGNGFAWSRIEQRLFESCQQVTHFLWSCTKASGAIILCHTFIGFCYWRFVEPNFSSWCHLLSVSLSMEPGPALERPREDSQSLCECQISCLKYQILKNACPLCPLLYFSTFPLICIAHQYFHLSHPTWQCVHLLCVTRSFIIFFLSAL